MARPTRLISGVRFADSLGSWAHELVAPQPTTSVSILTLQCCSMPLSRPNWIFGRSLFAAESSISTNTAQYASKQLHSATSSPARRFRLAMAPRSPLELQYMSSSTSTKPLPELRPSASIILLSPKNEILLLHRVRTSSSFASAHVFPGGNLSTSQDGEIPQPTGSNRHRDGPAYRLGAIRECFEESGILLAKTRDSNGLLDVDEATREQARKEIHSGKIKFGDWVKDMGGIVDIDGLHPFTRWVTPPSLPKRFTTQMYLYFLPLSTSTDLPSESMIPVPTPDGGIEHTAASFAPCSTWLDKARRNDIILFPPQFYLMFLLSKFLPPTSSATTTDLQSQRDQILSFLKTDMSGGNSIPWAEKVISPTGLFFSKKDGRSVLALDKPGPELKESGRGGDLERVVLVKFGKDAPRNVEVRNRKEVLAEEREGGTKEKL